MKKAELVVKVADKMNVSKAVADQAVTAVFEALEEALLEDGKFQATGFGLFEVNERAARKGHNPRTGEEIMIPASKTVTFKVSKKLKDVLNERG